MAITNYHGATENPKENFLLNYQGRKLATYFQKGINEVPILVLLKKHAGIWKMELVFGDFLELLQEKRVVMNAAGREI